MPMLPNKSAGDGVELPAPRKFGLLFAIVALAFAYYFYTIAYKFWALLCVLSSAMLLMVALRFPELLSRPNKAWYMLGQSMGRVVSPIVLGILFFLVISP